MWGITQSSSAWLTCCVIFWDQASTLEVWENNFKRKKRKEKKKHRLEPSHAHILSSTVNYPSYRAVSSLWEVFDPIRKLFKGWIAIWIFESLVTSSSLFVTRSCYFAEAGLELLPPPLYSTGIPGAHHPCHSLDLHGTLYLSLSAINTSNIWKWLFCLLAAYHFQVDRPSSFP